MGEVMNCKPGDLAIVVADGQGGASDAIGMIVEVRAPRVSVGGPGWLVKMQEIKTVEVWTTGEKTTTDLLIVADAWLRPITGLHVDEDVTDEVTA